MSNPKKEAVNTKCRAFCHNGDYVGPWRETTDDALNDVQEHLITKPGHDTDIEFTQSFIVRTKKESGRL